MSFQPKKHQKPYVIVVALDSLNGIQAAHIFARHNIPIIAIAKDSKHYGCYTRVCEKIIFTDTGSEKFIKVLETLGPKLEQKAVLVPCTDMNVLLISRNRRKLEKWYHVVLPNPDVLEMLMNKVEFYNYAQKNGIPIPTTFFLNSKADVEHAIKKLIFPCVLKPPMSSVPEWERNSKLKAYKISSPAELIKIYERFKGDVKNLIVQDWIEGTDVNLYSCNCYFNAQSEPIVTFVARKLRQWPPVTGESSLGEECRDDVVLEETVSLFQSAGLSGLGYVEIKRDTRTGKYFIIEPNIGRPTGRSSIAEAGGVELLYTMYCDTVGLPLPESLEQKYGNVKWIHLRRDLQSAFYHWWNGNLTLKGWWRSLRGRKAEALFSWTDPGPFFADFMRAIRLYLQPEEREKRNYRDL
ncbi:MAG: carboxylate--amine ligase [Anaerolineae bacterium]|jgi:predicted ATP-grasp superfamily ATP-dependent carboligase|nr:carboxylate--amine ligase [Anaerolineae bacterium]MBT4456945.1 carboxylate--amine ligase [Anaerolineae bacterium]MBT6060341.1 carboxylate--amine ligase [Anaerolineae bacterium]MBT6323820.1 carboxylate--amine ligase [Anaerolineae bacterium]MBT6814357.1 carboxylate--amine ligase [Anaerolineae bacterium]